MDRRTKNILAHVAGLFITAIAVGAAAWMVTVAFTKGAQALIDYQYWAVLGYAIAAGVFLFYAYVACRFSIIVWIDFLAILRGGAVRSAHRPHKPKAAGSNPAPATNLPGTKRRV